MESLESGKLLNCAISALAPVILTKDQVKNEGRENGYGHLRLTGSSSSRTNTCNIARRLFFCVAEMGCARCLHAEDDPEDGPIPTLAFVSFWSGLLLASYFLRYATGEKISASDQQIYITPFRPETSFCSPVAPRSDCPICQVLSSIRKSAALQPISLEV